VRDLRAARCPPDIERHFGRNAEGPRSLPEEGGKFIQTSAEAHRHRDAIQLSNGLVVPLQHLCEGQRIEVLSLLLAGEFVEERQSAFVR
jgi:hypothetical protein